LVAVAVQTLEMELVVVLAAVVLARVALELLAKETREETEQQHLHTEMVVVAELEQLEAQEQLQQVVMVAPVHHLL
jgi:hypothetical protein